MKFFRWSIFVLMVVPVTLMAVVRRFHKPSNGVDEFERPLGNESQLPSNVIDPKSLL